MSETDPRDPKLELQAEARDARWIAGLREHYTPPVMPPARQVAFQRRLDEGIAGGAPRRVLRRAWLPATAVAAALLIALGVWLPDASPPVVAESAPTTGSLAWEYEVLFPVEIAPWEEPTDEGLPPDYRVLAGALRDT